MRIQNMISNQDLLKKRMQVIPVMFCIFLQKMYQLKDNENRLKNIPGKLITIPAKDEALKNSKISDVREAQNRERPRLVALHQDLN